VGFALVPTRVLARKSRLRLGIVAAVALGEAGGFQIFHPGFALVAGDGIPEVGTKGEERNFMATTTQWEYHFLDAQLNNIIDDDAAPTPGACEFYDYANELGKQGWELVAVITRKGEPSEHGVGSEPGYRYYFKRPLQKTESSDQNTPGQQP
jgi:hypothetical protein